MLRIRIFLFKITHFFDEIRASWQRFRRGYCYGEAYHIDDWFIEIMPKMLKDLIEAKYQMHGGEFPELNDLLEMVTCFNEASFNTGYKNVYEDTFRIKMETSKSEDNIATIKLIPDYPENFEKWCIEEDNIDDYKKEHLKKGLELFIKYYDDLHM